MAKKLVFERIFVNVTTPKAYNLIQHRGTHTPILALPDNLFSKRDLNAALALLQLFDLGEGGLERDAALLLERRRSGLHRAIIRDKSKVRPTQHELVTYLASSGFPV